MTIRYDKDNQNIVTLTIDMPGRPVNVINQAFGDALSEVLDRLAAEESPAGVIVTSAKDTFVVGAEIETLREMTEPEAVYNQIELFKSMLRRLETIGRPVAAAMNGTALGGGLEVALACHYRIALDNPKARFGFPEVTLGLLPAGGGVTRLPRLIGLQESFPYLVEGRQVNPQQAQAAGIIHDLAADRDELLEKARAWILANPEAVAPWDKRGFKIPGGDPRRPKIAQMVVMAPAMLKKKTYGNYPAPEAILSAMVEGTMVDFDTASRVETRYFVQLATGQVSKNMINAFWFQLNEIKAGRSRPAKIEPVDTQKVGVLGAGMMGHGIAYVTALAGLEVVLKDVTQEKAGEGKAHIEKILNERVRKNRLTQEQKQDVFDRILATDSADDLKGCDLVIEAVFESRELKGQVTREAEAKITADAVFASNTSTLPITGLAEKSARPQNFIGLHFFSPVHKMRLVEIIRGEQTSDKTLAKAFDYVLKIGKTPIVVNDSRGFYTSRVFGSYIYEGLAMLAEGQHPRAIEAAGLQAGMPVGPLAVSDEINLGLAMRIREQTRQDFAAEGKELPYHPGDDVLHTMVNEAQRPGRAQGAGFYDYPPAGPKYLWPKLPELFPAKEEQLLQAEMIERMMFVQALETARCYDEGVVASVADANIGSIFGWGFAPFKGGTLQYINDYGLRAFVERSRELAEKYGERFMPPDSLVEMAEKRQTF